MIKSRALRLVVKSLKWAATMIGTFYILGVLVFGISKTYHDGTRTAWSGLEALWKEEEEFGFYKRKRMEARLKGTDGPYIIGDSIYRIDHDKLYRGHISPHDTIPVCTSYNNDSFYVALHPVHSDSSIYSMPGKLLAISDIEGNFTALVSFLERNKVVDKDLHWIYGDGHLVLNGDFVDRGEDVLPVLWLVYQLEQEAEANGGKVHYILGNHEVMNFGGDWAYNKKKYIRAAQLISGEKDWDKATCSMYADRSALGHWLRAKNVAEKIGPYIFVHGGLSPGMLQYDISLDSINAICRANWDKDLYHEPGKDETANFLMGSKGPLWYRGLVMDHKYYEGINEDELHKILSRYGADRIIVGHTLGDDIQSKFDGKVIDLDVRHGKEKNSGATKGLLIERNMVYVVDDTGGRREL